MTSSLWADPWADFLAPISLAYELAGFPKLVMRRLGPRIYVRPIHNDPLEPRHCEERSDEAMTINA